MMLTTLHTFFFGTLRRRLIFSVAALQALLMLLFIADLARRHRALLTQRQSEQMAASVNTLAGAASGLLASHDLAGLQELVETQRRAPGLRYAMFLDEDGHILAHTDQVRVGQYLRDLPPLAQKEQVLQKGTVLEGFAPIMIANHHLGWSYLGIDQTEAHDALAGITRKGVIYSLVATLVGSLLAWLLGSRVVRRLSVLQSAIHKVQEGQAAVRSTLTGTDEVAALSVDFNRMLDRLDQGESNLKQSEESYRRQFTDNTTVMLMIDPDTGRILEANTAAVAFYGYSREHLLALGIGEINQLPPGPLQAALDSVGTNQAERFEFQHRLADGSLRDVQVSASRIRLGERHVLHSIIHDMTERKQAVAALLENQALLAQAQAMAHVGSWVLDRAANRLTWSDEVYRIFGATPHTSPATYETYETFLQAVHPEDRAAVHTAFADSLQQGKEFYEIEHRVIKHDTAEIRFVHEKCQHVRDAAGDVTKSLGMVQDITERKHLEKTSRFLAQAEWLTTGEDFFVALGRFLAQHLVMDYVCIDRLLGEGLTAKTLAIWFDGHTEDNVEYALKDTPCGDVVGRTICCFPNGVRHQFPQDQVLQDMRAESYLGTTLWGSGGQPIGLIALIGRHPITTPQLMEATLALVSVRAAGELERRNAEAKLNESLAFTHELIASMQDGFTVFDRAGLQMDVNPSFCRMTGFSREELVGAGAPYPYWPPEELETIQAALLETIKGITTTFELTFMRKNGERFPVLVSPAVLNNSQGRTTLFSATVQDITERKRAEQYEHFRSHTLELLAAKEPLAALLKAIVLGVEHLRPGMLCSVLLLDSEGRHLEKGVAPSLPDVYNDALDGIEIGVGVGSCGTAAFTGKQVIVADIATHPYWAPYKELAAQAGLAACWSQPIRDARGQVLGTFAIYHRAPHTPTQADVDLIEQTANLTSIALEHTRAEAALRESEARWKFAIEGAGDGLWDWTIQTGKAYFSPRYKEMYGYAAADIGTTSDEWSKRIHPDDAPGVFATLQPYLEGKPGPATVEYRMLCKDGSWRWALSRGMVVSHDTDGKPTRMIGTNTDITERKQAEAEKLNLQAQLQQSQKMESLGTLAGGVAHDMNNVLGAILGLASAHLDTQPCGSPLHQALDTICKATERGGKMVKSLLSFARQSPVENNRLDMNAILQGQILLLERTTLAKVCLQIDLEAGLRPILGDAGALTHAFMNLCVNAVDAMPENGTLTLHTRNVDNDWIEVVVEDNGMGMPKEILEKAMEPFFTTKETGKGTGLGLSMVFSTVKAHRGQMVIESEPNHGTRVRLRFPACEQETSDQPAASAAAETTLPPREALKVLLVDDDDLIQSSMQAIFEVLGYTVHSAPSGEEALAVLEAGLEPDLVILDMNMPGLGGIGTLPRLRRLHPGLPVLLSTGRADHTAQNLAAAHPGVTLLAKPFGLKELQRHLESLGLG